MMRSQKNQGTHALFNTPFKRASMNTMHVVAKTMHAEFTRLKPEVFHQLLYFEDYHNFAKSRFPAAFIDPILDPILAPFDLTTEDLQIEIAKVTGDHTHYLHFHTGTEAVCLVMGHDAHVPAPSPHALVILEGRQIPATEYLTVEFPVKTPHTFTCEEGGSLWFLSIQSPPLVRIENGQPVDDFYLTAYQV